MRARLATVHRWCGLLAAAFWLTQAITGMLIVFHWELRDAGIAGAHRPTDLPAIARALDRLSQDKAVRIASIWTSAGSPDRYDVNLTDRDGQGRTVRIDGAGQTLEVRPDDSRALPDTLVVIHQSLLLGSVGGWIVGISGILLVSNLLVGMAIAWPRRGTFRLALAAPRAGLPLRARLFGWHRAIGLWAVFPALLLTGAGALLAFEDGTARLVGASPIVAPTTRSGSTAGFLQVATLALRRYPGATLTAVAWPESPRDAWTVRVRQPAEWRRAYGTTIVMIDGAGHVVAQSDALTAPVARRFMDSLYALHTGEAGGLAGRIAVASLGAWLATMIALGVALWWRRTRRRTT